MGFFSRLVSGPDWARDPIPGDPQWLRLESPRPDLQQVVHDAIAQSGVDPAEIDLVECFACMLRLIVGEAAFTLESGGHRGASEAFDLIMQRDDYTDDMLWNYFSHQGAPGIAAQRRVAETFSSGQATEVLARIISEGGCRIEIHGRDRI